MKRIQHNEIKMYPIIMVKRFTLRSFKKKLEKFIVFIWQFI